MNQDEAHRLHAMGWEWFKLLAQQRMQLVSFWFVAMSFLTTGAIVAYASENYAAATLVFIAVIGSSIIFFLFDRRTQELLKRGETLMVQLEPILSRPDDKVAVHLADGMHESREVPYRALFRTLYLGTAVLAGIGLGASVSRL